MIQEQSTNTIHSELNWVHNRLWETGWKDFTSIESERGAKAFHNAYAQLEKTEDRLIEAKLLSLMQGDRQKLMSYLMLTATRNLVDSDLTSAKMSQNNTYNGKRYHVAITMEIVEGTPTCTSCKHFYPYTEMYEDPLEDYEAGKCTHPSRTDDSYTTVDRYCQYYKNRIN